jgi:pimeloyl-ACP methyl ester carboxylesterase
VGLTFGRRVLAAAILATVVVVSSACDQGEEVRSEALAASRAVTFASGDLDLAGRVFGPEEATAGVVLAHMLPADQSAWYETAAALGARGYRALTFDFRGYCPGGDAGCSEGDKDIGAADEDLRAAVAYLRDQGVSRISLVGASMGGTAALIVAGEPGTDIVAVVTLSAPQLIEDLAVSPEALGALTAAKLFIAGTGDVTAAQAADAFYNQTQQPKREELVTTDDHGTDLLSGNQGSRVESLIEGWLAQHMPPAPEGGS